MDLAKWFEALGSCVKPGDAEPDVNLRCLAPGKLYEAKWGRKRVCAADPESALMGLLHACGGELA